MTTSNFFFAPAPPLKKAPRLSVSPTQTKSTPRIPRIPHGRKHQHPSSERLPQISRKARNTPDTGPRFHGVPGFHGVGPLRDPDTPGTKSSRRLHRFRRFSQIGMGFMGNIGGRRNMGRNREILEYEGILGDIGRYWEILENIRIWRNMRRYGEIWEFIGGDWIGLTERSKTSGLCEAPG